MKTLKNPLVRVVAVLSVFGLLLAGAATMLPVTTYPVARNIPFFTSNVAFDSLTGGQPGGQVRFVLADDSLLVGDIVYWSDTNTVNKSATLANYSMIAGVVVGGTRLSSQSSVASADVGTLAATVGQRVIILKQGRTWIRSGQNGIVIAGRRILPSDSIAGRFDTSLTASVIDTFYRMVGRTVTAAPALGIALVDVNIK